MKYAILLLLCSCAGTDAKPDEFRVDLGRGHTSMDSATTTTPGWWDPSRSFNTNGDSESTYVGIGWTWRLGDVAERDERRATEARLEALYRERAFVSAQAPAPEAPKHAAVEEKPHEKPAGTSWFGLLAPYIPAVALGIIGLLNRMGKVNWLEHKENSHG